MDLAPVITRLKAQLTGVKQVGGAAELDAAADVAPPMPSAFVMPLAETGEPPSMAWIHEQRIAREFSVVLVLANRRDATGAAATQDLHALRMQVRAALLGWSPDPGTAEAVSFTRGRLLRFSDGRLWWADEFQSFITYRSA